MKSVILNNLIIVLSTYENFKELLDIEIIRILFNIIVFLICYVIVAFIFMLFGRKFRSFLTHIKNNIKYR